MLRDIVAFGIINRALVMSMAMLILLLLGMVMIAAKASAPFIYTLF